MWFAEWYMPAKKAASPKPSAVSDSLWAYVGSDDLQVKESATLKARELTPASDPDFGLEIIEGAADNSEAAQKVVWRTIEAIQTLPFFGGEKVVWLKGVTFLADSVTGKAEGTLRALEELQGQLDGKLPPDVKFVLSATDVDKRRAFYLFLKRQAHLEVHDLIDTGKPGWEEQVATLVRARAEEHGLTFKGDALEYFTMLAGESTRQIDNELEKLDLYLGENRVVTTDDVREIVSQTKKSVIFELGDAIGKRNLPLALALTDVLLGQGESAVGILLATIVPKIKNLSTAKYYEENYKVVAGGAYGSFKSALERLPEAERQRLPQKKDGTGLNVYPLYFASQEAGYFSAQQLQRALEACLQANRRLVTSGVDAVIVLNQLLFAILGDVRANRR